MALSDSVELANKGYKQLYYRQTRGIDMSRYDNFKPIGTSATLNFCGTYDGQNYKISNLRMIYGGTDDRATALFGKCGKGTLLSNIVLENCTAAGNVFPPRSNAQEVLWGMRTEVLPSPTVVWRKGAPLPEALMWEESSAT